MIPHRAMTTAPPPAPASSAVDQVGLGPLMARTEGSPQVRVGLVDGPVAHEHADLSAASVVGVGRRPALCADPDSRACAHGTFVAGILVARRGSPAPAVCPGCTLLVRPIFGESVDASGGPVAVAAEAADAITECVEAGASVVNLSAAVGAPTVRAERALREALDHAAARGALVVAAAGNQGTLGSSEITRHPWVIPVVAVDGYGRLLGTSNAGASVGRRGLAGPGDATSLSPGSAPERRGGTSVATAFVTGAAALLRSVFPDAPASAVRRALVPGAGRRSVVPPLLDARAAFDVLAAMYVPAPAPPLGEAR